MATCNRQTLITAAAQAGFNSLSPEDQWAVINQLLCNILANGGGGPGGPFLPTAGGTMTGPIEFSGLGSLLDPLINGIIRLNKDSGANGPVNISNGGPWIDPSAPTAPVLIVRPTNVAAGNMDIMPNSGGAATKSNVAIDILNGDLFALGTVALQTWLHLAIGSDGNYYVGGDVGAGGTVGQLILQERGKPVGIGNFGQNYGGRVVPYYLTIRPYTTTLNLGIEIDTEAVGMQLHSINDAGTRLPLSTVTSNLVFAKDLLAGQRTKFLTVRPLTNVNLVVHNTVETGTATTAVELQALADDETTQKTLVTRALQYEFTASGSSVLKLRSSTAGGNSNIYSDNGGSTNKPIMFGKTLVTPLLPFQFNNGVDQNVCIDSTTINLVAYGRVSSITDAGSRAPLTLDTTELSWTPSGTYLGLTLTTSALTRTTYGGSNEWYGRSSGGSSSAPTASTTSSMARFIGYFYDGVNSTDTGVRQVETATAVGTITGDGDASVTVTGAGISGSPVVLSVPVLNTDTAATWAGKVRTAIAANAAITAVYATSGATTSIVLTRNLPAANDPTLNIALANGTCTGITAAPTSVNTTAGVAIGASWNATAYWEFRPTSTHSVSNRGTNWELNLTTIGTTAAFLAAVFTGIGTVIGDAAVTLPNASAVLDVPSTTRGFLPPRMSTAQKNAISSPATGLMVFDTGLAKLCVYTGAAWETVTSI